MTLRQRFWSKVQIGGPDECWPWTGNLTRKGYGQFYWKGTQVLAHRMSFKLSGGTIPDGHQIRHTCDFRRCCNFGHLLTGTPQDNSDDMVSRGRSVRGEACSWAKMTEATARAILAAHRPGASLAGLAVRHHVSVSAVKELTMRRTWKHL